MRQKIQNFFDGLFNVFIFLPYFFSVKKLLFTMFDPWKNLTAQKTSVGFSFNEWLSRLSFNLISRAVGFVMRSCILMFFVIVYFSYIVFTPAAAVLFFLAIPLVMLLSFSNKSDVQKKEDEKQLFLKNHLLDQKNLKGVEQWFEYVYQKRQIKEKWWSLEQLLSNPPLAVDWSSGYTPTLDQYVEELTLKNTDQIIGRIKEIREIETILSKREEANVLLVGEDGIGKSSIVYAFGSRIAYGKSTPLLNYKRVLKLNLEKIFGKLADTKQREALIEDLFLEAGSAGNCIIFIEHLERYVRNDSQHSIDITSVLEKFAKTPKIQFLATTTPHMHEQYIHSNESLNNLFAYVSITPFNQNQTLDLLLRIHHLFESRYDLFIAYEALISTVEKSDSFILDIPFPEKAINVLDTACSLISQEHKPQVQPQDIDRAIEHITHMPTHIDKNTKQLLVNLEMLLDEHIIGQKSAVLEIAGTLRRSFVALDKRKKPLASFLFLGPTGTGKTETAKTLGNLFFKHKENLLRFDMSNYQTKENTTSLIETLAQKIRNTPYAVLLFDEIEKSHKDLLNVLLTLLDEGYITDTNGKSVNCKDLIVIGTSNAASDYIYTLLRNKSGEAIKQQEIIDRLIDKNTFSPEFLNRFDGIIVFAPLDNETLIKIAAQIAQNITKTYAETQGITVEISKPLLEKFIHDDYQPQFGARNLEHVIKQHVEDELAKLVLTDKIKSGDKVSLH